MNAPKFPDLSRRNFLAGSGALIVSFSMLSDALAQDASAPAAPPPAKAPPLPGRRTCENGAVASTGDSSSKRCKV